MFLSLIHIFLAGYDAFAAQNLLHGFACQLRMVVLLAEMTEPDVMKFRCSIIGKRLATIVVAQMTVISQNAILQILGIMTLLEHLYTMVRLEHKIVGTADKVVHLFSNMPHIGDETEVYTTALHEIANIVGTVVGYTERSNLKLAQCESYFLLYHTSMVRLLSLIHI